MTAAYLHELLVNHTLSHGQKGYGNLKHHYGARHLAKVPTGVVSAIPDNPVVAYSYIQLDQLVPIAALAIPDAAAVRGHLAPAQFTGICNANCWNMVGGGGVYGQRHYRKGRYHSHSQS